jgi:DNA invertase Pin-like site-specific DNA recombinase
MRCALYMRVSTGDQSTDMQRRELVEFCTRRGWEIVAEYEDIGVSGSKDSRPELNKLMADAQKCRFDAVIVWKFDRFARSVSHLLRALETFQSLGIEFCSFSESIDTSSSYGKMVFTILGAVAELERALTVERVKAGMKSARARGVRIGRRAIEVDSGEVHRRRAAGETYQSISKQLGISLRTIYRNSRQKRGVA